MREAGPGRGSGRWACSWSWSLSNVPFYTGGGTGIQGWSRFLRRDLPRPKWGSSILGRKRVAVSSSPRLCVGLSSFSGCWQGRQAAQAAVRSGMSGCLDSTRHGLKMAERLTWGQTVLLGGGQAWLLRVTRLHSVALWAKASPPLPSLPASSARCICLTVPWA